MGKKDKTTSQTGALPASSSETVLPARGKHMLLMHGVVFALIVFVMMAGNAKADMASDIVLANTCFSCHGTDGDSAGAMPTIKGKSAEFIEKQLVEFRDGNRDGTVMGRIAKGFTNDEIKTLSRYFAGQQ